LGKEIIKKKKFYFERFRAIDHGLWFLILILDKARP
jgi:hypothetical protein